MNRMWVRNAMSVFWLAAIFAGALLLNDIFIERRMANVLTHHPEIVMNAVAYAESQRADTSAMLMQQKLTAHWDVLSQTHAYAVRFNGSEFTSRLVRIGDVATPKNLDLIATDYRCHFCKSDRIAVAALLRANPDRDFVFMEAAVLGPESIELASEVLQRAQKGEGDYYSIHNRAFDAPAKNAGRNESTSVQNEYAEPELLAEQRKFLDIVGVFATPTYVRNGVFRSGTLGTPDG
jgi:hypothetical protein